MYNRWENGLEKKSLSSLFIASQCWYRWTNFPLNRWIFLFLCLYRYRTGDTALMCKWHCSCCSTHSSMSSCKTCTSCHLVLQGKKLAAIRQPLSGESVGLDLLSVPCFWLVLSPREGLNPFCTHWRLTGCLYLFFAGAFRRSCKQSVYS